MARKTFADLRKVKPPPNRCAVCNEESTHTVVIQAREKQVFGRRAPRLVTSRSLTLCEHHAVLKYERMGEILLARPKTSAGSPDPDAPSTHQA